MERINKSAEWTNRYNLDVIKFSLKEKRKEYNKTGGELNLKWIFYAYDLWSCKIMCNVWFSSFSQVFKINPLHMKETSKRPVGHFPQCETFEWVNFLSKYGDIVS